MSGNNMLITHFKGRNAIKYIQKVEEIVNNRWSKADDRERETLVEIMTLFESKK
ncbi:MAG: hypothetical protein Q4C83_01575 [Candidatus Saccharibacteria bacterium]|nr:hypothetical protein [Candidatus Saccharibacteria bacterium]